MDGHPDGSQTASSLVVLTLGRQVVCAVRTGASPGLGSSDHSVFGTQGLLSQSVHVAMWCIPAHRRGDSVSLLWALSSTAYYLSTCTACV